MVLGRRKRSLSPRRDYSDSSRSPRRGRNKSRRDRRRWSRSSSSSSFSRSSRSSKGRSKRRSSSPRRSRSRHSRKSKSKERGGSSNDDRGYTSRSPRPKRSSKKEKSWDKKDDRSSSSRSPRAKRSALKKKKQERGKSSESEFSSRSTRNRKKPDHEKRNDSGLSSTSVRDRGKRGLRHRSPGGESARSFRSDRKSGKNSGSGRKGGTKKKRNPHDMYSSSENDGNKYKERRNLKQKKLPFIQGGKKHGRGPRQIKGDSCSSGESEGSRFKASENHKPWCAANEDSRGSEKSYGHKLSPPSRKKGKPKFRARRGRSEANRDDGFEMRKYNSFGDHDNEDHPRPLNKKKAQIWSDRQPRGIRLRKKKANLISQIQQLPRKENKGSLPNPMPPTNKESAVLKAQEKANELLRQQVKKLQNEMLAIKNAPPAAPPGTVSISKSKLEGILQGKIFDSEGGVENAIVSLVNKGNELEGQLAKLKDELQKKRDVEKSLENMKDELQRNLERIEKSSPAVSANSSRSDDTIYSLSQRIAAVEQENREMRQKEMSRYSISSATSGTQPLYYQSPTPMQPVVHIHQPTPYQPYQGYYQSGRDTHHKPTHFSPSPGEPPFRTNSPYDHYSEQSFADGGDIAELCSALAATVDLVKKVINVDA